MSIHPKDILFYAGGECLQKFGVPVMRQTRAQDVAATITRSGAVGPLVGKDGVLRSASANRVRGDWVYDSGVYVPTTLLEAARTNLVTSDDLTAWSTSGTSPVVTGSVDDPAGGTGAYSVEDDDTGGGEYIFLGVTVTGGSGLTRSASWVVRENTQPSTAAQVLRWRDSTAGATRLQLDITGWTGGEPTITETTGSLLVKRYIGNGYWLVIGQTDANVNSANTNRVEVQPAGDSTETGVIDVYRVNAFDSPIPSHSILDASEVRNADTFYGAFSHSQQPLTIYAKFREWGTGLVAADQGVVHIGSATSSTDPRLHLYHASGGSSGIYTLLFDNGTAVVTVGATGTASTYGDTVELRAVLDSAEDGDGDLIIGQSVNGGAEGTATASGPSGGLGTAFADTRLYIGSLGSTNQGLAGFESVKVARGVQTMADMRAVYA